MAYFFAYTVVPALLLIGILYSLLRGSKGNETKLEKGLSMDAGDFLRSSYGNFFFFGSLSICVASLILVYFNIFPESMALVLIGVFSLFLSIIGFCLRFEKGTSIFMEVISVGVITYLLVTFFILSKKVEAVFGFIFYIPIFGPFGLRFFDRIFFRKTQSFYVYFRLNFVLMGLVWMLTMIGSIVTHNFF